METILVCIIVGVVGILSIRSLYRTLTGKDDGCGCEGSSESCGKVCSAGEMQTAGREGGHE